MSKVSACLLVRDDASTLVECLESIKPHVDELCILDTGSSIDDSEAIAKQYADKWERYTGCNDEAGLIANFADARNRSYQMASHDTVFWMDADDIFVGGEHLRPLAARATGPFEILIPYEYAHDDQGHVTCYHYRENLAGPKSAFHWAVPVHEVLTPDVAVQMAHVHEILPGVDIRRVHRKQKSTKPRDVMRNLRILWNYVQQTGETDVRAMYYLGVEQSLLNQLGNALMTLRRYIELADWSDEKCLATLEIANIHARQGDYQSAVEWGMKAMIMKSWCEPFFMVSQCFFALAQGGKRVDYNLRRAARFAQDGLRLSKTNTVLFVNPQQRFEIHRILNVALGQLGMLEDALQSCKDGLAGIPGDKDLTDNAALYEQAIIKRRVVVDLTRLETIGKLDQQWASALAAKLGQYAAQLPAAPPELPAAAFGECTVPVQTPADGCLDIALFVGPQFEPWNPETLAKTGMGGSEVMAWEMSKRLRGLGHRVRVFGHCNPEHEGLFDGVEWLAWQRFQGTTCDVLITSRRPEAVEPGVCEAKARILWCHDTSVGDALTYARALRIDRVLALTQWHRSLLLQIYAGLDPATVVVTRNGVDYGRFSRHAANGAKTDEIPVRFPHRLIYSSSPDRGLHILLDLWPQIIREIPDAELRVAYGFENIDKAVAQRGDANLGALVARIRQQMAELPGVTNLGRLSPAQLTAEQMTAGCWCFPTWWSETSCITAMEAMAAGLHIVATPVAALNETLLPPAVFVPGVVEDPYAQQTPDFLAEFYHQTIQAMRRAEVGPAEYPQRYGLDELAKEWDAMLRELVVTVPGTVPKWEAA